MDQGLHANHHFHGVPKRSVHEPGEGEREGGREAERERSHCLYAILRSWLVVPVRECMRVRRERERERERKRERERERERDR